MASYREIVREAISKRDGKPFLNGSVDHAAVIVQEVLGNAKKAVCVLSHRLDTDCYARPGVKDAARFFLADPDHDLRILIESELWDANDNVDWSQHPLLRELNSFAATGNHHGLQARRVPKDWSAQYQYNFMIMDDFGFRYESDRQKAAAVVAFLPDHEKETVAHLQGIFDQLWEVSSPINFTEQRREAQMAAG